MDTNYYCMNALGERVLRINVGYMIEWHDIDNNYHTDFFVNEYSSYAKHDLSYVHVWNNPTEGLRKFLETLPLHNVIISPYIG